MLINRGEEKMKKIIVLSVILIAVGFAGCYIWINMGLSEAINEKTLNISYDEFMQDENIQRLDLKMKKDYEGGYFFDKYTEYEAVESGSTDKKISIKITVDNSKKEIEQIAIYCDFDNEDELFDAKLSTSLYATFFSETIDKDITEDASLKITEMLMNFGTDNNTQIMDSFKFHGIEYKVGMINCFSFVISPEK